MPKKRKPKQSLIVPHIRTTRDLRISLLHTYEDLIAKRITPVESRAHALHARAILDTVRAELMVARTNVDNYKTIDLTRKQDIAGLEYSEPKKIT